jgi:hypothetical protein
MPFLVMEFVRGRSFQDILAKEGAMPPQRAWEYISAIRCGRRRRSPAEHRSSRSEAAQHHGPGRCADRRGCEDPRLRFGEDQIR